MSEAENITEEASEIANEPLEAQGEPEAKVESETPSGEDSTEKTTEAEKSEKEKKRNSVQERISEITRQRREAEAKAAELEARLKQYESANPQTEDEPTLADFDYNEAEYVKALRAYNQKQSTLAARQARAEEFKEEVERLKQQTQKATVETFQARSQDFAAEHADYYQTIQSPGFQQSQATIQAVLNSDNGPALAYHLAKNPDLNDNINRMSPVQALMELGRIEAKLTQPVAPKTTSSPPPVKPVGKSATVDKDPDKMTPDEYRRWRLKQKGS